MIRKIIKIDEEKCNGCGACATACHEGAIDIIDGKAKLTRENYCDGLGDCLAQWPCQIKLVPVSAPYFAGADLLIAADCTAYAYANIHADFMKGRVTLIGCPKLDAVNYSEKLTEILKYNDIKSVTLLRMEVPCCGGLEMAVKKALENSQKQVPLQVYTVSIDGRLLIN